MTTIQKKILFSTVLVISLATLAGITQPQIFAEETIEKQYTHANNIQIHTVFSFNEGIEESDGFQVFKQTNGFSSFGKPAFTLEGVVDSSRIYLYEAADYSIGNIPLPSQKYGQFNVDIYLHNEGATLRHFSYINCNVSDYKVDTLFDKEEAWNTSKGFAIIDNFKFECNGYQANNPLFDLMKTNGYHIVDTVSSLDLVK